MPPRSAKSSKPQPKTPPKKPLRPPQPPPQYKPRPLRSNTLTPPPPRNILKGRVIPIFFGSITLFCLSGYLSWLYVKIRQEKDSQDVAIAPSAQADVSNRYDHIARSFDASIESTESLMGLSSLRKELASLAHGDVLEVSIGTGRNLEFYDWDFNGYNSVGEKDKLGKMKKGRVRSFTAVDKSAEMLEIAHEKFGKLFPGILGVRWVVADAAVEGKIPGPPRNANERSGSLDKEYDTVIQTMGLCSASDPVALLKNLGKVVKEEEGRILLLEHGRGKWAWLNRVLDNNAEGHAKEFGCWWNRDLKKIVEESGLEVVSMKFPKFWHGGTTYWIELKRPKAETRASMKSETEKVEKVEKTELSAVEVDQKKGEVAEQKEAVSKPAKKGWW